jgi:hypothetical protein
MERETTRASDLCHEIEGLLKALRRHFAVEIA